MSMAWITGIQNQSQNVISFRQSDPSWHPVIKSSSNVQIVEQNNSNPQGGVQVQSGQTIKVLPGGSLVSECFVIPWSGYGRLEIIANNKIEQVIVGAQNGKDFLSFDGVVNKDLPIGNQHEWSNLEFTILIEPTGSIRFTPTGGNNLEPLRLALIQLAYELGKAIWDLINGNNNKKS